LRVYNLENGRSVVVRVNDRGPRRSDRLLDVSYRAAERLGFSGAGLARVRIEPL
jgi:rare lipoprotein A